MISCQSCRHFTADTIGDGGGIGRCRVFEAFLLTEPGPYALSEQLISLGNAWNNTVFWGGSPANEDRNCESFAHK